MARIGKFFFFDGSENLATVFYYHVRSNGGVVESIGCVDNTSSFLEQSSFLLSPSGYKEDTVYTQKPIGATGNLTFTRGSDSWRTNVQGLVERTPYNFLRYSEEFSNAVWTKTGCTISANLTTAPNGTLTADKLIPNNGQSAVSGDSSLLIQSLALNPSVYTYSIYAKAAEFTSVRFRETNFSGQLMTVNLTNGSITGGGSQFVNPSAINVGDGWYRISFTSNSTTLMSLANQYAIRCASTGDGTSGVYIWGAQLVEGAYPLEYFPTTDRLDVPRIDYSYGTCPALLLEPQRTNLITWSDDFSNAVWTKISSTVSTNTTTSPDGLINADTLSANGTTAIHALYRAQTVTSATPYTFTIYAKANTGRYLLVRNMSSATYVRYGIVVDLQNGTVTQTSSTTTAPTGTSHSVTSVGNGWYRIAVTMNSVDTSYGYIVEPSNTGTPILDSFLDYTYLGTESYYIYGAQLEQGAYPTSYIKTEATTVTRLADSFSRNNIYTNNLITSAGGTWYVELRNNIVYTRDAGNTGIFIGDDINATNSFRFRTFGGGARTAIVKSIATTESTLYITTTDIVKFAIKWNGSTADLFVNGVKQVSATPFTTTAMQFLMGNAADTPKYIQGMALYPVPLDDVDCELLTNPTSSGYSSFASMASSLGYILI